MYDIYESGWILVILIIVESISRLQELIQFSSTILHRIAHKCVVNNLNYTWKTEEKILHDLLLIQISIEDFEEMFPRF